MADFDIAVVGSSLFSGLLAGILARDHGRKVARIGRQPSAQRLPRRIELALPLATRPETWRLMRRAEAEMATVLGSIGVTTGIDTTEAALLADLPGTASALDHLAHMAAGYGHQVGRLPNGWAFRRVSTLIREPIEARLGDWLNAAGVTSLDEKLPDADLIVLADDAAIFDHLTERERPPQLISQPMTATLVVSRPPAIPVQRFADRGITLVVRPGNSILALVSGEADVEARLSSTLTGPFPMKRLATTRYRRFVTSDGAPLIGPLKSGKQFITAGLGDTAAFLAPAIARLIAGTSDGDEKHWLAAHDPMLPRDAVADFASPAEAAP
jgi:hypothetical protein